MVNKITKLNLLDKETQVIYGDNPNAPVWISTVKEICRQIIDNGAPLIHIHLDSWDDMLMPGGLGTTRLIKRAQRIAKATGYQVFVQGSDKYVMKRVVQY